RGAVGQRAGERQVGGEVVAGGGVRDTTGAGVGGHAASMAERPTRRQVDCAPGRAAGVALLGTSVSDLDVPLSVLDLARVGEGSTSADALRSSLALAAEAERL